ncbi:MAG: branched-chain amino acid ABC transporter permease [Burkholderiaceae bacterium]|nr:branched-chain amino acid ABC transporter permease [Burkholderiaceae bacterium]
MTRFDGQAFPAARPAPLGGTNAGGVAVLRDMAAIAAGFLVLALFVPMHWLTDFAVFCILVLSFDLLYGQMGRLSFGHILYYGVGAYAASLTVVHLAPNPFLAIAAALLACFVLSTVLGAIVVRTEGATFALLNLALNQIGFWLIMSGLQHYTKGEDGLSSSVKAIGLLDFNRIPVAFAFMLGCLLLVFGLLRILTRSPYGVMIRSIKENEERVKFLGYGTFRYKWLTFVIAATLAGFAGALHAIVKGFVAPGDVAPLENTRVIFAVLIGGAGNLYGAVVGGVAYELLTNLLATKIARWEMFLGVMLLVLVFWFRRGITGYVEQLAHTIGRRRRAGREPGRQP